MSDIATTEKSAPDITLTKDELYKVTGYKVQAHQLRILKELGIPARRRTDNSIAVLRVHCMFPVSSTPSRQPQLRSLKK